MPWVRCKRPSCGPGPEGSIPWEEEGRHGRHLPTQVAEIVTTVANDGFVDAMTNSFIVSAVILTASVVLAVALITRHMRPVQAEAAPPVADPDAVFDSAPEAAAA